MIKPNMKLVLGIVGALIGCTVVSHLWAGDSVRVKDTMVEVIPIQHASLALRVDGHLVVVDPVGETNRYTNLVGAPLVLVTHAHRDHFDVRTLDFIAGPNTRIVGPPAVIEALPEKLRSCAVTLTNGQSTNLAGVVVYAVPMYNVAKERLQYHPRGVGNGYVIECAKVRIYVSGDTDAIPEMADLQNVDIAFLCMDGHYTMKVEEAVEAVKKFEPAIVYPYHYRGASVDTFREKVETAGKVKVRVLNWYPERMR